MHDAEPDSPPHLTAPRRWFLLAFTLLCLAAAPTYWYLAEQGVLPWNRWELRWNRLRAAPAGEAQPALDDASFVSLRWTLCFGYCPDYTVTVFASGRIEFVGRTYVCDVGPRTAVIDRRVASKLISDLEASGYFEIEWKPGNFSTDSPSAITRLSTGGKTRTIDDYYGDAGVPRVLHRFEEAIDEVAGTARWLPKSEGAELICTGEDGSRRPVQEL